MTEYWTDFVQESSDRITELNNALLSLEHNPDDPEAMEEVFRIAHTLKGNCGAAGLEGASELAHAIEDLLDAVRGGRLEVSPELMDDIFDAVDELETIIETVDATGSVDTDPSASIQSLRDHLEGPAPIEPPTEEEIEDVLSRFEPPADDHDQNTYLVRISVDESEAEGGNAGILVVKALIDAFDLIGTAPPRDSIEAHAYNGRFDAVFTSAVTKAAIASGLEPVDEVADFELVDVTEQFEAVAAAPDDESEGGDSPLDERDEPDISPDEAQELEVDELLGEFDQYDDLDELVEEVEDDDDLDAFDDMGKAGSFDDLLGDDDVEVEFDEGGAIDTASDSAADVGSDGDQTTDDPDAGSEPESGPEAAGVESDAEPESVSQPGASATADADADAGSGGASTASESADDDVDDAEAVFQELKDEVEMVGFDELQEELEELEFDEFDTDDEVGMDELLGDDIDDAGDDPFLADDADGDALDEVDEAAEDLLDDVDETAAAGTESTVDESVTAAEPVSDSEVATEVEAEDEDEVETETDVDDGAAEPDPGDTTGEADEPDGDGPEPDDVVAADPVDEPDETAADDTDADAETELEDAADDSGAEASGSAAEEAADDDFDTGGFEPAVDTLESTDVEAEATADSSESQPETAADADDADDASASEPDEVVDFSEFGSDIDGPSDESPSEDDAAAEAADESAEWAEPEFESEFESESESATSSESDDEPSGGVEEIDAEGGDGDEAVEADAGDGAVEAGVDDDPVEADTGDEFGPVDDTTEDELETDLGDETDAFDADSADEFAAVDSSTDEAAGFDGPEEAVDTDADVDAAEVDAAEVGDDASEAETDIAEAELDASEAETDPVASADSDVAPDADDGETGLETAFDDSDIDDGDADGDVDASVEESFESEFDDAGDEIDASTSFEDSIGFDESDDESFEDSFDDDTFDDLETDDFEDDDFADDDFTDDDFGDDEFDTETAVDDSFGADAAETDAEFGADETASASDDRDDGDASESDDRIVSEPDLEIPDISLPDDDLDRDAADETDDMQSVRVDVEQIDDLLTLVEGLVTSRVRLRHAVEADEDRQALETELDALEDITTELQDTVMDVRLVPLETVTNRLPRVVRDIARDQDKRVAFEMQGEDVELDRTILDRISDPLIHLVRNAVDHGIEPPEQREELEKPTEGTVEVTATRTRDRVSITVEDDGSGIDPDRLRSEAVEADVISEADAEAMADEDVYDLVFHPGLSTADEVTDVSGRGVGMDVVKRTVTELDGSVSIDSTPGDGTSVTMTLPVSIAIDDILFLESGAQEFGIPTEVVHDVEPASAVETEDGEPVLPIGGEGETVPVVDLGDALDTPAAASDGGSDDDDDDAIDDRVVVRIRDDVRSVALRCDRVHGQQEVVVKPFDGFMNGIPGLSGATVRGRGQVVNILDVTTL